MKTLKNLFNPEDFSKGDNIVGIQYAADKAQLILDQFIEENGVILYKHLGTAEGVWTQSKIASENYTHTALIINIEQIKQCKHKVAIYVENHSGTWFECEECGKPVKAKGWEVV